MKKYFPKSLLSLVIVFSLLDLTTATAVEQKNVDVVAVTWSGAAEVQGKLREVIQAIDGNVGPQWLTFTSLSGDTRDKKILFSLGRSLASPILLANTMPCDGYQSLNFMGDVKEETYRRLGISNFSDRYLVIVAPKAGCIWQGKAMLGKPGEKGGVLTLHDTSSSFVIVHELGHALGLGHSNFLRCDNDSRDGAWGRDCRAVEYGGSIDVMGNVETTSPLSIYHQWRLGLLENSEIRQSWKSEEIELRASSTFGGTRAIFIKDGKSAYWLEFRKARSEDTYKDGLIIYRTDPPPTAAILSPNPEDALGAEPDLSVTADMWMLNLGDYKYSSGRASGSMTLTLSNSVVLASGNVEISVKSIADDSLIVVVKRTPDIIPPTIPKLTSPLSWRSPSSVVIESGYEDSESSIDYFEVERDGVISKVTTESPSSWTPSYLYPIEPNKVLTAVDLPEGDYNLRVRAIDLWGNTSSWSNLERVTIDRGFPTVSSSVRVVSASKDYIQVAWTGARDTGIGLCETNRTTDEGWILTRSYLKNEPILNIPSGKPLISNFQVVDCRGNAVTGRLATNSSFVSAASARKTGKWETINSEYDGSMRCIGKCAISLSAKGSLSVLSGAGSADVFVASKKVGTISPLETESMRAEISLELGKAKKVVRVQGKNFTIYGFVGLSMQISESKQDFVLDRVQDDSLNDSSQKELSEFGFKSEDFDSTWTVLPMARGTTLQDPTLDLCEAVYATDQDRIARRQVTATKVGSPYLFLSTEIVRYKTAEAAQNALAELRSNLQNCITNGGGTNRTGAKTPYQFSPQQLPRVDGLVSDSDGVYVHTIIGSGSQARVLLGFYQFSGDQMSGLYIVQNQTSFFSQSQINHWSEVAAQIGKRLQSKK